MAGVWFRLNLNLRKTTDWLSFGHVSDSIKWALIDAFYMADNSLEKNFITLAITGKHTSTGKLKIFYVNTQWGNFIALILSICVRCCLMCFIRNKKFTKENQIIQLLTLNVRLREYNDASHFIIIFRILCYVCVCTYKTIFSHFLHKTNRNHIPHEWHTKIWLRSKRKNIIHHFAPHHCLYSFEHIKISQVWLFKIEEVKLCIKSV